MKKYIVFCLVKWKTGSEYEVDFLSRFITSETQIAPEDILSKVRLALTDEEREKIEILACLNILRLDNIDYPANIAISYLTPGGHTSCVGVWLNHCPESLKEFSTITKKVLFLTTSPAILSAFEM